MNKIKGTLLYVCVPRATKAYIAKGEDPKPDEWKASVAIVDEDYIDEFEAYAKSVDSKVSVKKVKASEFEAIYKCPVPEGAGKNVWIVTLRKSTKLGKTGEDVPEKYKPRVFQKIKGNLIEITNEKLVGNGSVGAISIDTFTRNNGTSSLYLKNVMVEELIEYVATEGSDYNPGDEFGEDDTPAAKTAKAEKPVAKPTARKPAKQETEEDDIPF